MPYPAHIITVDFEPTKADALVQRYQQQTLPLVAMAPGLVLLLTLMHRSAGHWMAIRVVDSPEARALSDLPSAAIIDDLAGYASILRGAYTRDPYDVTVYAFPRIDPAHPASNPIARVTVEDLRHDGWDEAVAALRELTQRDGPVPAPNGGIALFENRGTGRVVLIEAAVGRDGLASRPTTTGEHERMMRHGEYRRQRATQAIYEVVARVHGS